MVDGISTSNAHKLIVSDVGNEVLKADTNKALHRIGRESGEARGPSILELGSFGRFKAHLMNLGSRTSFVTEQNERVVRAFQRALNAHDVSGTLSQSAEAKLQSQVAKLNANKTLLTFADIGQALEGLDDEALQIFRTYVPASSDGNKSMIKADTDGSAFKALAEKHGLNTPELKEKFRQSFEAQIFGLSCSPEGGPRAVFHELAALAESSAVALRPGNFDKSVKQLFAEFPTSLHAPKNIQDGKYQIFGNNEGQTFIYWKRMTPDNIPYEFQGANDLRNAKAGNPELASTPAAQGKWTDVPQKFHFSVDVKALHEGNAWPALHKLLTSEENPFLQFKIGNADGLSAAVNNDKNDIDKSFFEEGPRLFTPTLNAEKRYPTIPRMEEMIGSLRTEHNNRQIQLDKGEITKEEFDKSARNLATYESELGFLKDAYKEKIEGLSGDRCITGAQFTLYTQHEKDKPWNLGEVKKYTQFLQKLESVLTAEGIQPGKLPESDVTIPGMRFATFRDEAVGDAAEQRARDLKQPINYQLPPASLLQEYRETPFYNLAKEAVSSDIPAVRV